MRVLVTGGAGFIGSHVVEALTSAGHEVRVLDALLPCVHPDGAAPFSADPGFEFVHGDVRDAQTVDEALRGIGVVCHLAAMVGLGVDFDDAPMYAGCNDLGTAVLLAAMARARATRLVMASSMVVYGEGAYSCAGHGLAATPPPRQAADLDAGSFEPRCERCGEPLSPELVPEDAPLGPRNVYAATKLAQEHLAGIVGQGDRRARGGAALSQRLRPGDAARHAVRRGGVVLPLRLEAGRAPRVFEDGEQRRDFVHVRDVAGATVTAIEAVGGPAVPAGRGPARLQRGQRHPAHRGPAGVGAGRRLRRARIRLSPASTGSATSAMSPRQASASRGNWGGGRQCRSPGGSRSSPPRRPGGRPRAACPPDRARRGYPRISAEIFPQIVISCFPGPWWNRPRAPGAIVLRSVRR